MIESSPAFFADLETYRVEPCREQFRRVLDAAGAAGQMHLLIPAMRQLYFASQDWRTAQHLALLCEQNGYLTYAVYYSELAIKGSQGDIMARAILAKVLWRRRLPLGVLYQTDIMRVQIRRMHGKCRKRLLQEEIARLNVCAYAYLGRMSDAKKWLQLCQRYPSQCTEMWLRLLLCSNPAESPDLHIIAGNRLAGELDRYSNGVKRRIKASVRIAIIALLRKKAAGR